MTDLPDDRSLDSTASLVELGAQFTDLGRVMLDAEDGQLTIDRVLQYASAAVAGSEHAAVTLIRREKKQAETLAATGELARVAERLQLDTGEGPCLDALTQSDVVRVGDLAHSQWPVFGRQAEQVAGIRSIIAFRLYLTDSHRGALNFFSTQLDAFDEDAVATGAIFAAYISLALSNLIHEDKLMHLERALESNREIGMALGVLAARELWTPEQAFDRLREASQQLHRKLRDIAAEVVRTGQLPPTPGGGKQ